MPTLREFFETQPQEIKDAYLPQVTALENTIKATRQERDELAKSKPSADAQDLQTKLTASERRIAFLEGASTKGVRDARLAWALAQTEGTFTEEGKVDWAKLKDLSPALFSTPLKTNAGSGTETQQKSTPKLQDAFKRGSQSQI